jgi:hypothetical protein
MEQDVRKSGKSAIRSLVFRVPCIEASLKLLSTFLDLWPPKPLLNRFALELDEDPLPFILSGRKSCCFSGQSCSANTNL